MIGLLLTGLAAAADCPSVDPALARAAESVSMMQLSSAEVALDKARDGMACSEPLDPEQVSRYFQIQAVLALRQVNDPSLDVQHKAEKLGYADQAFSIARALAPDAWISDFGEKTEYQQFVSAPTPSGQPAKLILVNRGASEWVVLDGGKVTAPYLLSPGLHVIQVGAANSPGRFARELSAPDGGVTIDLALPPPGSPSSEWRDSALTISTPVTPAERRRRRLRTSLISGVAGAALYGGAVATRAVYNIDSDADGLPDNPSDGLNTAANGLFLGSVGSLAASGVYLTLGLTTR